MSVYRQNMAKPLSQPRKTPWYRYAWAMLNGTITRIVDRAYRRKLGIYTWRRRRAA